MASASPDWDAPWKPLEQGQRALAYFGPAQPCSREPRTSAEPPTVRRPPQTGQRACSCFESADKRTIVHVANDRDVLGMASVQQLQRIH
jgi:hypothetical protein